MNRKKIAKQLLALARQLVALEFDTKKQMEQYKQEHEVQPDTKLTVKEEEKKSPAEEKKPAQSVAPSPTEKPADKKPAEKTEEKPSKPYVLPKEVAEKVSPKIQEVLKKPSSELQEQIDQLDKPEEKEDFHKRLSDYNLESTGADPEAAVLVAASLAAGISETADTCKMTPPVCEGNLGITRANMPQLHDKNLKDMLTEANENDVAGEDLEKKAAAETDEKKKKDLISAAKKARADAKEGRMKVEAAKKMGVDENEKRSTMDIFLDDLEESGVKIDGRKSGSTTKIPVKGLRATQREIQAKKTMKFSDAFLSMKAKPGKKPWAPNKDSIIVSTEADGSHCILDGHHRWSAALVSKPNMEFNCIVVNMPIRDMLTKAHKSKGVYRADLQSNVIDPAEAGPPDLTGWKSGEKKSVAETPVMKKPKTSSARRKQAARSLLLLAKSLMDSSG